METKKLAVAIIEDEKNFSDKLKSYFDEYQKDHEVSFQSDAFLAPIDFLDKFHNQYDIICLDIQMPGYDGFQVAEEIRKTDKEVIIVLITSFSQYALRGYEIKAFDYILKPFSYEEFNLKMKRILNAISNEQLIYAYDDQGIYHRISPKSIIYFEIYSHDITVHTTNETFHKFSTLKEIEQYLPQGLFLRVKNCYLVNKEHIIGTDGKSITLDNRVSLSISRSMKKEIISLFKGNQ